MLKSRYKLLAAISLILAMSGAFAAERHELRTDRHLLGQLQRANTVADQHAAFGLSQGEKLELLRTNVDPKGVSHSRYRQTIGGVPVWGEQVVISRDPSGKVVRLHGRFVKGLANELFNFTPILRSEEALNLMKDRTWKVFSADDTLLFENESVELVVYLDGKTPVLSYAVSFFADIEAGGKPTRPTYLIDASSGAVLFEYEGLTHTEHPLIGTGPGGNEKTGRYEYGTDFDNLDVLVSGSGPTCTMDNANVKTVDLNHETSGSTSYSYPCPRNVRKEINGAYSPLNDAHYFGGVVFDMYDTWVGSRPLDPSIPQLTMRVHYSNNYENAFWNGSSMTFGDGYTTFYPLVSLDVSAHEVSHGFTEQYSGLIYSGQSGGINEAYSDMAGEAAEYYARSTNDFLVGAEIYQASGAALRDMENPPSDGVSIDHIGDYYNGLDVHYSSGIYNKAFYTLANTTGWNTQSAFQLFAYANRFFFTPSTSFRFGAFAVVDAVDFYFPPEDDALLHATKVAEVEAAFFVVGIDLGPLCDSATPLPSGESITISGDEGSSTCFETVVPADTDSLTVSLTVPPKKGRWKAGAGDPDLYLRWLYIPDPSNPESGVEINDEAYDCRSISSGGNERCIINSPAAGSWYTLIYGWSAYNNVTVEAILVGPELPPTGGTEVHVHALDGAADLQGKKWRAAVTITVFDDGKVPVPNATINGSWDVGGSGACTTDGSGTCTIKKSRLNSPLVKFTVSDVAATGATYVSGPHEDFNSDSVIFGIREGYITVLEP